jgi:hypothetical protein
MAQGKYQNYILKFETILGFVEIQSERSSWPGTITGSCDLDRECGAPAERAETSEWAVLSRPTDSEQAFCTNAPSWEKHLPYSSRWYGTNIPGIY